MDKETSTICDVDENPKQTIHAVRNYIHTNVEHFRQIQNILCVREHFDAFRQQWSISPGHNKQRRKLNMYRFVIAYRLVRDVE